MIITFHGIGQQVGKNNKKYSVINGLKEDGQPYSKPLFDPTLLKQFGQFKHGDMLEVYNEQNDKGFWNIKSVQKIHDGTGQNTESPGTSSAGQTPKGNFKKGEFRSVKEIQRSAAMSYATQLMTSILNIYSDDIPIEDIHVTLFEMANDIFKWIMFEDIDKPEAENPNPDFQEEEPQIPDDIPF